jgi:hypothetical protein
MSSLANLKRLVVSRLLQDEDFILLVVRPGVAGVELPGPLMEARQPIGIHIGYRMTIPVPDLELDDRGVSATLSFDRAPFRCFLPWDAVEQIVVDEERLIWLGPLPEHPPVEDREEPEHPSSGRRLRLV